MIATAAFAAVLVRIVQKPRSEQFKSLLEVTIAKHKAENIPDYEHVNQVGDGPLDDEVYEEASSYDPDILTKEDITWSDPWEQNVNRNVSNFSNDTRIKRLALGLHSDTNLESDT
jgi:hypothetical protein